MSIRKGFHYDDYEHRYYRDEQGNKIPEDICLCFAFEPSECSCDCTSWVDEGYLEQLEWQEHQEESYAG